MKYLITLLLTLAVNLAFPQDYERFQLTTVDPPSPEASELGKYGEHPVSFHSGLPSINIPMFDISIGNITVPIGLNYHASGVKVEQIASRVGMGWSLSAVSAITRSVMGSPDEIDTSGNCRYSSQYCHVIGFEHLAGVSADDMSNDLLSRNLYDYEPDRYFFNFPGGVGDFYIGRDNSVYLVKKEDIQIKVPFSSGNNSDQFIVTTNDGLIYTFQATEEIETKSCQIVGFIDYTSSWFLTNISDPINDRSITFTYTSIGNDIVQSRSATMYKVYNDGVCNFHDVVDRSCKSTSKVKNAKVLSRIDIDSGSGGYIEFGTVARQDLANDLAYDEITYYDRYGSLIKKYHLNYDYKFSSSTELNKRLFLASVQEEGRAGQLNAPFLLTYKNPSNLPSRDSKEQDIWGYYNANGANASDLSYSNVYKEPGLGYVPFTSITGGTSPIEVGIDRSCNSSTIDYGIIQSITYPTGGKSVFEFEPHQFSVATKLYSGGGLRISKITTFEDSGSTIPSIIKEYEYSPGTIFGAPIIAKGKPGTTTINIKWDTSQSPLGTNSQIFYSEVTEKQIDGQDIAIGKTVYGYINQGNLSYSSVFKEGGACNYSFTGFSVTARGSLGPVLDYVKYYEEGNPDPIKVTDHEYEYISHEGLSLIAGASSGDRANIVDGPGILFRVTGTKTIESAAYLPIRTTETITDNNANQISTVSEYLYNDNYPSGIHNLSLKEHKVSKSKGGYKAVLYKYPFDFSSDTDMMSMVNTHQVNKPTMQMYWDDDLSEGRRLLYSNVTDYNNFSNHLRPSSVFQTEISLPIVETNVSPVTSLNSPGSLYDHVATYDRYDDHGNVTQVTDNQSGVTTSYIWGYNQQYLVAKVINATYSEIESIIGSSTMNMINDGYRIIPPGPPLFLPSLQPLTDLEVRNYLDPLYNALTAARVSIYTHNPLIGIVSETDENRVTTYYEYDNLNRLVAVKDTDGHILREHKYNYGN